MKKKTKTNLKWMSLIVVILIIGGIIGSYAFPKTNIESLIETSISNPFKNTASYHNVPIQDVNALGGFRCTNIPTPIGKKIVCYIDDIIFKETFGEYTNVDYKCYCATFND